MPNLPCAVEGHDGATYRLFSVEYRHNNGAWSLSFYALDFEDAQARVASIRATLGETGPGLGMVEERTSHMGAN